MKPPAEGKKPKECTVFEAQAWRKERCKNCFRSKEEHVSSEGVEQSAVPGCESPSSGDPTVISSAQIDQVLSDLGTAGKPSTETHATSETTAGDGGDGQGGSVVHPAERQPLDVRADSTSPATNTQGKNTSEITLVASGEKADRGAGERGPAASSLTPGVCLGLAEGSEAAAEGLVEGAGVEQASASQLTQTTAISTEGKQPSAQARDQPVLPSSGPSPLSAPPAARTSTADTSSGASDQACPGQWVATTNGTSTSEESVISHHPVIEGRTPSSANTCIYVQQPSVNTPQQLPTSSQPAANSLDTPNQAFVNATQIHSSEQSSCPAAAQGEQDITLGAPTYSQVYYNGAPCSIEQLRQLNTSIVYHTVPPSVTSAGVGGTSDSPGGGGGFTGGSGREVGSSAPIASDDFSDGQTSPVTADIPPPQHQQQQQQQQGRTRQFHLIRRQRSMDSNGEDRPRRRRRNYDDSDINREDAMMEGTRMMMETLREKIAVLEDRCDRLDREKQALGDLLAVRKAEFGDKEIELHSKLGDYEDSCRRLHAENNRLNERLKLPESERNSIRDQENEIVDLRKKMEDYENRMLDMQDENQHLQHEINDLHLEMEEMHDQFREDEAMEFRELQKELEGTAKNCRILQFKLRKSERRCDQMEADRMHYEEKIRQLEKRLESDERSHIKELEEELRMAKEVSVRLHDELETVEERRVKSDQELARLQDYLRESENRRTALTTEVSQLNNEIERLRASVTADGKTTLEVPREKPPMLRKMGSQGSTEYDVESLMRDLADHLERENDLRDQLSNAEEEIKTLRQKISDMESENESINIQLEKISAARSGKYFKGPDTRAVITEEQHDLALQLDLVENENTVLRRKMSELEEQKEKLETEVRFLQDKLSRARASISSEEDPDERPYDDRIEAMGRDIDELKWKLIQKDQQVEKLTAMNEEPSKKGKLQKSKSLDSEVIIDYRRQMELIQQEADVLKDKVERLERQNEALQYENKRAEMLASAGPHLTELNQRKQLVDAGGSGRDGGGGGGGGGKETAACKREKLASSRGTPTIAANDAVLRCFDLEAKMGHLKKMLMEKGEQEGELEEKLARVGGGETQESFYSELSRAKIRELEDEVARLSVLLEKKSGPARSQQELDELLQSLQGKKKVQLIELVKELQSEMRDLTSTLHSREEENGRLEEELNGYRDDIDNMMETFRQRERELLSEMEYLQSKNNIIACLLDTVADHTATSTPDSKSGISVLSESSDEVFTTIEKDAHGRPVVHKNWDEQFKKRLSCLEMLVDVQKRSGRSPAQGKLDVVANDGQTAMTDDAKLHEREKEIIQKESELVKTVQLQEREKDILERELNLCQKQLKESHETIRELKHSVSAMEQAHESMRKDYMAVSVEVEELRKLKLEAAKEDNKKKEKEKDKDDDKDKEEGPSKESLNRRRSSGGLGGTPASWRWEKQEFERQLKDLQKKHDDLHRKLQVQQVKLKSSGADQNKEVKLKEQVEKLKEEKNELSEENTKLKAKIDELEKHIKEVSETLETRTTQWDTERQLLETNKSSALKEAEQLHETIRVKDDIITEKTELVRQKDAALKEREEVLKTKETIIKQKEEDMVKKVERLREQEDEFNETKQALKAKEELVLELETTIKTNDDTLRQRDERLREKDEMLEKLNKDACEKESRANIMEKSMRDAQSQLQDKDHELTEIKSLADDYAKQAKTFEGTVGELTEALNKGIRERDKETAGLVIQREKLENQLEFLKREKKCADDEIRLLRKTLNEKEEDWGSQRSKYQSDLKSLQEKLHSHEKAQSKSDVLANLTKEKDGLLKDRQRLEDVVKKLRSELEKVKAHEASEIAELRKVLYETRKKLEDKEREYTRLLMETKSLREQGFTGSRRGSTAGTESSALSPTPSLSPRRPLSPAPSAELPGTPDIFPTATSPNKQANTQELFFRAERVGMEELYETRMRVQHEHLAHAQSELTNMRKEIADQKELLASNSKTLSELKNKYDIDLTSWNEERVDLERKAALSESRKKELTETRKQLEEFALKLNDTDAERRAMETKLELSKQDKENEKTASSKALTFRERDNILKDTKKLTKSLEEKLTEAEKKRQEQQKDILNKLEEGRREWEKDRADLLDRNAKLDEKSKQLAPLQRTLIDLQYKLHSYRESWLRDRSDLQRQVDEARTCQLEEKQKFVDLLAEVATVKTLVPQLQDQARSKGSSCASTESERHRTETVIELSGSSRPPRPQSAAARLIDDQSNHPAFWKALDHMSQLAEDLSRPVQMRTKKSGQVPRIFRRSISSPESEIETAMKEAMQEPGTLTNPQLTDPSFLSTSSSRRDHFLQIGSYSLDAGVKSSPQHLSPSQSPLASPTTANYNTAPGALHHCAPPTAANLRRSQSTTENSYTNYPSSSLERPSRTRQSRPSSYTSGTQSAYSSRDSSPEKGLRGLRKKSPYPAPPPSFLVTPPRSPRTFQPSPHCSILTSDNMMKLYEKLGAIDDRGSRESLSGQSMTMSQSAAIAQERTAAQRVLMKSASMDSEADDPAWFHDGYTVLPERMSYIELKKASDIFQDAPLSETLPASIRIGRLVITPGIERLTRTYSANVRRSKGVSSPNSNRRHLIDGHSTDLPPLAVLGGGPARPRIAESAPTTPSIQAKSRVKQTTKMSFSDRLTSKMRPFLSRARSEDRLASSHITYPQPEETAKDKEARSKGTNKEKEKDQDKGKSGGFLSSVKEKRKMFSKKSTSIDNSILSAGVQAAQPAAPSSYQPPHLPDVPLLRDEKKEKKKHKRGSSMDLSSFFTRSRSREPSLTRDQARTDTTGATSSSGR